MKQAYMDKIVTPQQAVMAVRSGDWVDYGFSGGFPELLDKALAARRDELSDVKIRGGLVYNPRIEVIECDPEQKAFSWYSWHIGGYERKAQSKGLIRFVPALLRQVPFLYRQYLRTDVAFVPVSVPDEDGYCGLGIADYTYRTIMETAGKVIFEINEKLPTLQGLDGYHRVHLSEADYIVEGEHSDLPVQSYKAPTETEFAIAKHVVQEIPDGAVLALGVGGVPFTVANMIAESDLKNLGCHTGTISDAFMNIWKAGKLDNSRKEVAKGRSAWNLAIGSAEFYDWLRENPDLFYPADLDFIHSPERIGSMKNVISINGGVQMPEAAFGHRRAARFPGRRLPLGGRQRLHLHRFFQKGQGRKPDLQYRSLYSRGMHDFRAAGNDPERGDGVRDRASYGQDGPREGGGDDRDRAPAVQG